MGEGDTEDTQEDHEDRDTDAEKDTGIDLSSLGSILTGKEVQEKCRCSLPFHAIEKDLEQNKANEATADRPEDRGKK